MLGGYHGDKTPCERDQLIGGQRSRAHTEAIFRQTSERLHPLREQLPAAAAAAASTQKKNTKYNTNNYNDEDATFAL